MELLTRYWYWIAAFAYALVVVGFIWWLFRGSGRLP
jgi:hypothetical protein